MHASTHRWKNLFDNHWLLHQHPNHALTVHSSSYSPHEQVDLQRATLVKLDSNGAVPKPFACFCLCLRLSFASPIWHWLCRLAVVPRRLTGILPNSPFVGPLKFQQPINTGGKLEDHLLTDAHV